MYSKKLRENLEFPANYNEKRAFTLEEQQIAIYSVKDTHKCEEVFKVDDNPSNLYLEETIRNVLNQVFEDVKKELIQKLIFLLLKEEKSRCILCHKVIRGILYSCSECPVYFICAFCEENVVHHHDLLKTRHFQSNQH